jgi:hypothetical protein
MSEATLDTLEKRLERVERENRRLKRIGSAVLLLFVAALIMGQARHIRVPKVVEAERFILRDGSGNIRAELETIKGGSWLKFNSEEGGNVYTYGTGGLRLSEPGVGATTIVASMWGMSGGSDSAWLTMEHQGPKLELKSRGILQVSLSATQNGGFLGFLDQEGKGGAALGNSGLYFHDANAMYRAGFGLERDGSPSLSLWDKGGQSRATLELSEDLPSLTLRDETAKVRAVFGHISLKELATGTIEQRPASSLVFFNTEEKTIWRVP